MDVRDALLGGQYGYAAAARPDGDYVGAVIGAGLPHHDPSTRCPMIEPADPTGRQLWACLGPRP
ncbi:hypothetical protein GHK86_02675 [Acidimicrobiaceae bacterium USS-CC1]|uniref:Uncharacterized protein n=1 Tax=Acidiferrimicrobium australe TaxID=2664430 RepID=A0ABW9QPA2_9ACTN|nr:hypothetical protein [Acidiferrimicrobium australe]